MQRKPAFQMLWFVSIVFTAFHKYFIFHGVLFCFVLCLVVRNCIVDATFGDNFYFCLYFCNKSRRERELSKFTSIFEMFVPCVRTIQ